MDSKQYSPPYIITDEMLNLVAKISEQVGSISAISSMSANPQLRRDNQIRSIQASLAIENNSLTVGQVTDIINGKRVLGPPSEIKEVQNAFAAYERLPQLDPYSQTDLLNSHRLLMADLTPEAGLFRSGEVGVFAGEHLVHMGPPAKRVPELIGGLLAWAGTAEAHPLIKSCVFHYEFEFIHPFADGNGRMGRMWQTLLLSQWNPLFTWLPVESIVRERQQEYYNVLAQADKAGNSTSFILFMLNAIRDVLKEMMATEQVAVQVTEQVKRLLEIMSDSALSARELMTKLELKSRPSFRQYYLSPALRLGLIKMTIPDKPNSSKQQYEKVRK